jgi:hypothetical protein
LNCKIYRGFSVNRGQMACIDYCDSWMDATGHLPGEPVRCMNALRCRLGPCTLPRSSPREIWMRNSGWLAETICRENRRLERKTVARNDRDNFVPTRLIRHHGYHSVIWKEYSIWTTGTLPSPACGRQPETSVPSANLPPTQF